MKVYKMSDWSEDAITVVDHEMYDLVHMLTTDKVPTESYKGVDVYRLLDTDSQERCLQGELHTHEDFTELVYIKSGSGMASIDGQQYMIQKGDILSIRPHQVHSNLPMPLLCVSNCLVSSSLLHKKSGLFEPCIAYDNTLNLSQILHLTGETMLKAEALIEEISLEARGRQPYYPEALLCKLNELLILLRRFEQGSTTHGLQKALAATIDYVHEHFDTVTLAEAAAVGSYNPTYFSRLFRNTMGQYFTEYVNKLRVNRAMFLLLTSEIPIEDISIKVGFKSKIHFYDVFRKYTGLTPGAIRKAQKPSPPPAAHR